MKSFSLIQLYFVLATLTGLILIIIASVSLVKMGLDQLIGVKPYPQFTAPYPPSKETYTLDNPDATASQKQALEEWEQNYKYWQENQKEFDTSNQNLRRDLAQSLAMLLVGLPVFIIHMPKVFGSAKE